jgi:PhnB protein
MAKTENSSGLTSIAPWLTVANGAKAVAFYTSAFGALETYRLDTPDGLIVRLSVDGAEFWISGGSTNNEQANAPLGGETIRMILVVADPHTLFDKALKAGATEIFPIGEGHGWRLGRLVDPFGLHWEIGHQL